MNHWARKLYFGASLLIGLQGGAHAVYVGGNPVMYVDPGWRRATCLVRVMPLPAMPGLMLEH